MIEKLKISLKEIETSWKNIEFNFILSKEEKIESFTTTEENFEILQQNSIEINNFLKCITLEEELKQWKNDFEVIEKVLNLFKNSEKKWNKFKWFYYYKDEIKMEFPCESEKFFEADKIMIDKIKKSYEIKNIRMFCCQEGIIKDLQELEIFLNKAEKGFESYLEYKRSQFPRFYFISDDELIYILKSGYNIFEINKYMSKFFKGIESLELEKLKNNDFIAKNFKTCIGFEKPINFNKPLNLSRKPEYYLNEVLKSVTETLKFSLVNCLNLESDFKDVISDFPSQIILLTNEIINNNLIEESFQRIQSGKNDSMIQTFNFKKDSIKILIDKVKEKLDSGFTVVKIVLF